MYCKTEIGEDDDDWEKVEDEIDDEGKMEVFAYTDGKTMQEIIEDELLCCNKCEIEIPQLTYDNGWCFYCYSKTGQIGKKVQGTIQVKPSEYFSKSLSCESCFEPSMKSS